METRDKLIKNILRWIQEERKYMNIITNKKSPSISIIVPIYNAEEELRKSVESILAQTEKNIELILVDDGSKDRSLQICEEYAKKDSRIRVIHQENAGVSAARNKGILAATGEYLGFVDSDDWIEPDMYESLLMEAGRTESDVVMCDATTVYSDGQTLVDTITQLSGDAVLTKSDFAPSLLIEMAGAVWRCIYRNKSYPTTSGHLEFPLGVKFSEDRIFNLYAFGLANNVSYLKHGYYNRYINKKSTVHRFHRDYFEACKIASGKIEKAICEVWDNNIELQRAYLGQFIGSSFSAACNYYYKTSTLSKSEKKEMVKKICDDLQLRTAIETYGVNRRNKWILNRKYYVLEMYARFSNWKHKR